MGAMLGVHIDDFPLNQFRLCIICKCASLIQQQIIFDPQSHWQWRSVKGERMIHAPMVAQNVNSDNINLMTIETLSE